MFLIIKKLNLIVTELFTRGRKLNIYLVFITQPYFTFTMPKNIRVNSMNYYENYKQLKQIVFNHSSDIDFKDFMNLYKM